jgi:hypothetical protein
MIHRNLESVEPPFFHLVTASVAEFGQFVFHLNYTRQPKMALRVVRGDKMRTLSGVFDELAAAFQFPYYFGENWAALDECLSDLDWLAAEGYVMAVSNVVALLKEEDPEDRTIFLRLLNRVCTYWATERGRHPLRQSKPIPFHILFQACEDDAPSVWNDLSAIDPRTDRIRLEETQGSKLGLHRETPGH